MSPLSALAVLALAVLPATAVVPAAAAASSPEPAADTVKLSWPWPWHRSTTTTPPSAAKDVEAFFEGAVRALGLDEVSDCATDAKTAIGEIRAAVEDYLHGNAISRAKALVKIGEAVEEIIKALSPCNAIGRDTHGVPYASLVKLLRDPRYYTAHNALTLALNLAEDHAQLSALASNWRAGDFQGAGFQLFSVILDVLEHPGIPTSNGTAAAQVSIGLAKGAATGVTADLKCFADVTIEIPSLAGGVFDLMTGVKFEQGLLSIFHGLTGLVPTFKDCMADRTQIMNLLHTFEDFAHPADLAKRFAKNLAANAVDISLETASAVLDYRSGAWERFGEDLGKILDKIMVGSPQVEQPQFTV